MSRDIFYRKGGIVVLNFSGRILFRFLTMLTFLYSNSSTNNSLFSIFFVGYTMNFIFIDILIVFPKTPVTIASPWQINIFNYSIFTQQLVDNL